MNYEYAKKKLHEMYERADAAIDHVTASADPIYDSITKYSVRNDIVDRFGFESALIVEMYIDLNLHETGEQWRELFEYKCVLEGRLEAKIGRWD